MNGWSRSQCRSLLRRRYIQIACATVAIAVATGFVRAQPLASASEQQRLEQLRQFEQLDIDRRLRVNDAVPLDQRALLDFGGFYTFSYLTLNDQFGDSRALRQHELFFYARGNIDGAHDFFLRLRGGYRDFNTGDSFDGQGDEPIDIDLDRAYYRFDLARARLAQGSERPELNFTAQVGRDFVYWGSGLTLARTLDGAQFTLATDDWSATALFGVTPTRTVDFDPSRPQFDHNTRRLFYGAVVSKQVGRHRPYVYALAQRDLNDADSDVRGIIATRYEYNSYYIGVGSTGALSDDVVYGVEAAYQFGDTLSNSFEVNGDALLPIFQDRDSIGAFGLNARIERVSATPSRARYGVELIYATGDPDRFRTNSTFGGNQPGSLDRSFNSFGLLNTGLALAPPASNLIAVRLGGNLLPLPEHEWFRRMQVGADVFALAKARRAAPIDEATFDARWLGFEADVYVNWQITSDTTLALRYGVFFPSEEAFGESDPRHFFFGGLTIAF